MYSARTFRLRGLSFSGFKLSTMPTDSLMPLLLAVERWQNMRLWYLFPLVVLVSLVYSASRFESAGRIVRRAARMAVMIILAMMGAMLVIELISRGL